MELKKTTIMQILCLGMFLISGYLLLEGNETIFPTTLVLAFVFLILFIDRADERPGINRQESLLGKAGRSTIVTFAVIMAVNSLLVSVLLPGFAADNNLTGLFDGDFVRVTINDVHEFAYMTCFLLVICITFLQYFRLKRPAGTKHETGI